MVLATIDSHFLENKNRTALDIVSCLPLSTNSLVSWACFYISICRCRSFLKIASYILFYECITIYLTVWKYLWSVRIKKGTSETLTLPAFIFYIPKLQRPVWHCDEYKRICPMCRNSVTAETLPCGGGGRESELSLSWRKWLVGLLS